MYKVVTLAGGIREPMLTCSSIVLSLSESSYSQIQSWSDAYLDSCWLKNFTLVLTLFQPFQANMIISDVIVITDA